MDETENRTDSGGICTNEAKIDEKFSFPINIYFTTIHFGQFFFFEHEKNWSISIKDLSDFAINIQRNCKLNSKRDIFHKLFALQSCERRKKLLFMIYVITVELWNWCECCSSSSLLAQSDHKRQVLTMNRATFISLASTAVAAAAAASSHLDRVVSEEFRKQS